VRSLVVCSLFLAVALSACASPPRALRWEVVGGEPRRAQVTSWHAFVAPGACAWTNRSTTAGLDTAALDAGELDGGASVYDRTASSLEMLAAPPELDPGRWSFHVPATTAPPAGTAREPVAAEPAARDASRRACAGQAIRTTRAGQPARRALGALAAASMARALDASAMRCSLVPSASVVMGAAVHRHPPPRPPSR